MEKKEVSLDLVLEILELKKKEIMIKGNFKDYSSLQKKLEEIEVERKEAIKGNKKVIGKILEKYSIEVAKNHD